MNRLSHSREGEKRRKLRVRGKISGSSERPRLSVFISNIHLTAQIIDDSKQMTLIYVTTVGQKNLSLNKTERAAWVGTELAKKAKAKKVKKVVLDRGSHLYHGRIKALAEAVRSGGVEV